MASSRGSTLKESSSGAGGNAIERGIVSLSDYLNTCVYVAEYNERKEIEVRRLWYKVLLPQDDPILYRAGLKMPAWTAVICDLTDIVSDPHKKETFSNHHVQAHYSQCGARRLAQL
jgi:hypothetical protein